MVPERQVDVFERWSSITGPCRNCVKALDEHVTSTYIGLANGAVKLVM